MAYLVKDSDGNTHCMMVQKTRVSCAYVISQMMLAHITKTCPDYEVDERDYFNPHSAMEWWSVRKRLYFDRGNEEERVRKEGFDPSERTSMEAVRHLLERCGLHVENIPFAPLEDIYPLFIGVRASWKVRDQSGELKHGIMIPGRTKSGKLICLDSDQSAGYSEVDPNQGYYRLASQDGNPIPVKYRWDAFCYGRIRIA